MHGRNDSILLVIRMTLCEG